VEVWKWNGLILHKRPRAGMRGGVDKGSPIREQIGE